MKDYAVGQVVELYYDLDHKKSARYVVLSVSERLVRYRDERGAAVSQASPEYLDSKRVR